VKALRGTLRPSRVNPHEPVAVPLSRAPRPPDWLDPAGMVAWRRLCAVLLPMRCLCSGDLDLLAVLADQLSSYEAAARFLREKGAQSFVLLDGDGSPKGVQPWPEIKIRSAAAAEIRRLAEHFGLSPASRSRVSAATVPEADEDPFAEFDRPVVLSS
jgi:P27 family predicted phage terminase small subunit